MDAPPFEFCKENYLLAPETYYRVGGPARLALFPRNADEATLAYKWMRAQPERRMILGRGSNVLIADHGFPGIVMLTKGLTGIQALGEGRYVIEAGYPLASLVREVIVPENYEGAGALTGIPGSVGGAVFMNAGTIHGCTCELVESVDLITANGPTTFMMNPSAYGYRAQSFCRDQDFVLRAIFQFRKSDKNQQEIYEHYLRRRQANQPQGLCCGSVFKNPENDHAGRLIEACGLKGTRRGGAVISVQHANFIMNEKNATGADILWLIDLCKRRVREKFGIELHEEVRIIA
jgi:UDP-N-acetylmuramate dehydrogenase